MPIQAAWVTIFTTHVSVSTSAGGAYYQTNPTGQIFNPANNVLRKAWGMDIFQDPTNAY